MKRKMEPNRYLIKLPTLKIYYPGFEENYFKSGALMKLTPSSPLAYRKALYKIALYFKREFSYDFIQYSDTDDDEDKLGAFIFVKNYIDYCKRKDACIYRYVVIGGCCFRRRKYTNTIEHWALQWIWLHPFERDKGFLSSYWNIFEKQFGDFYVEEPLSSAMQGFLNKEDRKIHADHKRLMLKEDE